MPGVGGTGHRAGGSEGRGRCASAASGAASMILRSSRVSTRRAGRSPAGLGPSARALRTRVALLGGRCCPVRTRLGAGPPLSRGEGEAAVRSGGPCLPAPTSLQRRDDRNDQVHRRTAQGTRHHGARGPAACPRYGVSVHRFRGASLSLPFRSVIGRRQGGRSPQGCLRAPEGEKGAAAAGRSGRRRPCPPGAWLRADPTSEGLVSPPRPVPSQVSAPGH